MVTVREARPDDAEELLAHLRRLVEEPDVHLPLSLDDPPVNLGVDEERAILADIARTANAVFLVAEANGRIAGVLDVRGGTRKFNRHAGMLGMSIAREWRNQGVGGMLLARAIEWARGTGIITRIELEVYPDNARAIHLYENHGFRLEGRRSRAILHRGRYVDALVMGLVL